MNLQALDKVIALAKSHGKDVMDFLTYLVCPICGQEGYGIESLTNCHRCDIPMKKGGESK